MAPPLVERMAPIQQITERTDRWVTKPDRPLGSQQGTVVGLARPLSTINTNRAHGYGKRGRDSQPPRNPQRVQGNSPSRNRKYRAMPAGSDRDRWPAGPRDKRPAGPSNKRTAGLGDRRPADPVGDRPSGGAASHRRPTERVAGDKGASKPKLERRVGGIAPNGNPQCWIAPNETEADPHRVAQRMKQVEYGKNSASYHAYLNTVPKCAHVAPLLLHATSSTLYVANVPLHLCASLLYAIALAVQLQGLFFHRQMNHRQALHSKV
jgi:hypothetical protein